MSTKISILQTLVFSFNRFVFRRFRNAKPKYQKYPSLLQRTDLSHHTLIFNVEGALLKSESLFPYFMLVAFEAGGLIRSLLLFILYPLICLMNEEMGVNLMVMVCFFGVKKESFRAGKAVLPKFFLEDVGLEIFDVLRRSGKSIGVSNLPQVMIEGFLKDYLEIEGVVGREMKVVCGYFVGFMEDKKRYHLSFDKVIQKESASLGFGHGHAIGITSFNKPLDHYLFSYCKEIYTVRNSDKRNWQILPRNKYPKPLIFHDGRLALRPTPLTTLAMFLWIPFGSTLAFIRIFLALTLPYTISTPLLAFSGLRSTITNNHKLSSSFDCSDDDDVCNNKKGYLYVCNHKTLLDPLYLAFTLKKKNLVAVTYSVSRVSEILAPIKTVRLTRDRNHDGEMMDKLLNQGDLVVCPEGTTCRESYLLRFSPLFSEVSDNIVPVALDSQVTLFHGTTASGLKALDPLFFLMDPVPSYTVRLLDPISRSSTCHDPDGTSKFEAANHVQSEIGKALGFECTSLTRRDKYLILAGNNGIVNKN